MKRSGAKWVVLGVIFIIALAGMAVLFPRVRTYLAIDGCLDRGGKWLHDEHKCEVGAAFDACQRAGGSWIYPESRCVP